ncbi:MAG TPA: hypothetical protein VMU16_10530 [Candidatus Binataceae bacterium]|nr:hypothetical protein [Candidatus Binataceae bacterium]
MDSNPKPDGGAVASETEPERRIFGVGAIMIGVAAALWFGAATIVARELRYPSFLDGDRGDVRGAHVPKDAPNGDPEISFGASFEPVTIFAGSGDSVPAWLIPAKPTVLGAVVLAPSSGAERGAMLPYAKFLHAAGLTVLAIDSGDSASTGTSWGIHEAGLLIAAADWLKSHGYSRIAALGVSEGAAAAILAQAQRPVFNAIVSDSAYARLGAMFERVPSIGGLNPAFAQTVLGESWLWLGQNPNDVSPREAVSKRNGAALMIIQNHGDQITPEDDGRAIAAAAGPSTELWIVSSNGHGDAIFEKPDEYASRVTRFLAHAFDAGLTGG